MVRILSLIAFYIFCTAIFSFGQSGLYSVPSFNNGHPDPVSQTILGRDNPIFLNPGFCGSEGKLRIVTSYAADVKLFSTSLTPPTNSFESRHYEVSVDAFLPQLKGGLGVRMNINDRNDRMTGSPNDIINLSYSPKITSKNETTIAPAIDLGINHKRHLSGTQLNLNTGIGAIINSRKSHLGFFHFVNWGSFSIPHHTKMHFGHTFDLAEHITAGFEGQVFRKVSKNSNISKSSSNTFQLSGKINYKKIKFVAGLSQTNFKFDNPPNFITGGSGITPIFGLGYKNDQISINGNFILPRNRTLLINNTTDDIRDLPGSYRTRSTFEIAIGYVLKEKG